MSGTPRKHGGAKRRIWRKVHIGIDGQTPEVRPVEVMARNEALRASKYLGRTLWRQWRIPSQKPRRESDELYQATRPIPDGRGFRSPGRGAAGPHRRPQPLHRPWHTSHAARRMTPTGKGELRSDHDLCNTPPEPKCFNCTSAGKSVNEVADAPYR